EEQCRGLQFCAEACPYKKIYFNYARKVSQHCIMCFPRLEQGVAPACARQCPGRLVFVGYLDDAERPIHKLVYDWEVALPLHPEYGTDPNIFYIPPLSPALLDEEYAPVEWSHRIPIEYLERLFGPRVHKALRTLEQEMRKTRGGKRSALMDGLTVYRWQELLGPFTADPAETHRKAASHG
ncbi:MAG: respiratory nitrate reductase subunit beta, partial [Chloroflexota bacterium]|nr:respiratory nitrate reductase subunit beta [Chloroflexota bacterium]